MTNDSGSMRRWLGMFFLAVSFAMMMWGQLVLHAHLSGIALTLYWIVCFAFSFAAVVVGILDVRGLLRSLKTERIASLRRAMRGIKHPEKHADGSLAEK